MTADAESGAIVVVGPGALGCLLAAVLHRIAPARIRLLDHDHERAALLREQGILLLQTGQRPEQHAVPVFADPAAVGAARFVLLCVKAPALAGALSSLPPLCRPDTLLLAFQNGMDHAAVLAGARLPGTWALAVTTAGANLAEPGHVRLAGAGQTFLGFPGTAGERDLRPLQEAAGLLNQAGLPASVVADIMPRLWNKLLINAGINALTALHRCSNGELLRNPAASRLLEEAVEEAASVARALGMAIDPAPVAMVRAVCEATGDNISSMLQDVRRGKKTEIEAINGIIVREAARLGLAVPVNRRLLEEVRALEQGFRD